MGEEPGECMLLLLLLQPQRVFLWENIAPSRLGSSVGRCGCCLTLCSPFDSVQMAPHWS